MKKIILSLSLLLFIADFAFGQTEKISVVNNSIRKNAIHLDVGGWGFLYSLNYEHRISLADNQRLALGDGVMLGTSVLGQLKDQLLLTFGVGDREKLPDEDPSFLIGLSANYLLGKTHNLEIGITPSMFINEGQTEFYFSPRIGYRVETPRGFLFRIGTSPALHAGEVSNLSMYSWTYLSFGYSF